MTSFNSSSNIAQMMNFEQAAKLLRISNKSPQQIAEKFNFQPKRTVKIRGETRITNVLPIDGQYNKYIEKFVIEKALNAKYSATYHLNARRKTKSNQWYYFQIPIVVQGNYNNIEQRAREQADALTFQYLQSYEDWEIDEFNPETNNDLIEIKNGNGVIVNERIIQSTQSGGQRILGKKYHKSHLPMKNNNYCTLNGLSQEWNDENGMCVYNFLFNEYKNEMGFKKVFKTKELAFKLLDDIFSNQISFNPREDGVSIQQIEKFCEHFGISMYAYDKDGDDILTIYPRNVVEGNRKKAKPLVFIYFDNHIYPIPQEERLSYINRTKSNSQNAVMKQSADVKKKEDEKQIVKQIIAPTEDEIEKIRENCGNKMTVRDQFIMNQIELNNFDLPFPLTYKNLVMEDNQIVKLEYHDKIIMSEPVNQHLKNFYESREIAYQGQTVMNAVNEIWSELFEFKFTEAPFFSNLNHEIYNALTQDNVKSRMHLGFTNTSSWLSDSMNMTNQMFVHHQLKNKNAICIDMCKCYSNCMYNPLDDWIVWNGKECLIEYDGEELSNGLYFVETDDITLFHKSNWYSRIIIEFAKQQNIEFKITHQIRTVDNWSHGELDQTNIFKTFIEHVVKISDISLAKEIINSTSGFLGKTKQTIKKPMISMTCDEIWEDMTAKSIQKNLKCHIKKLYGNKQNLQLYWSEEKSQNTISGIPMYIQILDWSNIHLYNMTKRVGGTLLYRKTDMIISLNGQVPTDFMLKPNTSFIDSFGKYRIEKPDMCSKFPSRKYNDVKTPIVDNSWNEWTDLAKPSSSDYQQILKIAIEWKGLLLYGRAGTGKTYVIHKGIEEGYLSKEKNTRLAYTNKASKNINGMTIHRALGVNEETKANVKSFSSLYKDSKIEIEIDGEKREEHIIVIDEISLIPNNIWNMLICLKQTFPKLIFILLGDERQCSPVENGKEINYFNHTYVRFLTNKNRFELTEPQRYDMKLWNWLENFYENGDSDHENNDIKFETIDIDQRINGINICFSNRKRKEINRMCMEEESKTKKCKYHELPDDLNIKKKELSQDVYIYIGLPIMCVVANKKLDIVNCDEFKVVAFDDNKIHIKEEDGCEKVITYDEFNKYFVPNYCITTHKAQGMTYNKPINIFEWYSMRFQRKLGYTAISRAKNCEQITINW